MNQNKVVWGEGTLITPQHFQQQERYFEASISKNLSHHQSYYWGFKELHFNTSTNQMGILEISKVSGFFKNGAYFEETSSTAPYLKIQIPPNIESEIIYLAWSSQSEYLDNYTSFNAESEHFGQYLVHEIELLDATEIELPKRTIMVANKNLRLAFSHQLSDDMLYLPIAKITSSTAHGEYWLDEQFIPPFVNVASNQRLNGFCLDIQGILKQRAQTLAGILTNPSLMTNSDVRDFLILQTINRYHAYMHHIDGLPLLHPCDLYENWLKLYGDLSTFENAKLNFALPKYNHEDLDFCYTQLLTLLKQALAIVLEQKAILIPFEITDDLTRVAITPDQSILNNCRFVLAVNANMPAETLRQKLPATAKIGSVEKIKDLVAYHLPGIKIQALTTAPRELPYYSGFSYFEMDKTSELWSDLHHSSGIALHLAGEFPELQIEFWAIKPTH